MLWPLASFVGEIPYVFREMVTKILSSAANHLFPRGTGADCSAAMVLILRAAQNHERGKNVFMVSYTLNIYELRSFNWVATDTRREYITIW